MSVLNLENYYEVFQTKSFRNFWVGFSISGIGDSITSVALNWFVWESTRSATALGLLTFFFTGPVIFGGLIAGWLLDRYDRKKVMLVDSIFRGFVVLLIPVLYSIDQLEIWHIYTVAGVYGALFMITLAGGPSLVPSLVKSKHLSTANALETISFTLSSVIGPPIAGFLIARIAAPNVVLLDVLTYILFALLLTRVTYHPQNNLKGIGEPVSNKTYTLKDAANLLLSNRILFSTTFMFLGLNIGVGLMLVWIPIFSDSLPGGGAGLYGTLLGGLALGEIASSILVGMFKTKTTLGTNIILAQILGGLVMGMMVFAAAPWMIFALLFIFGFITAPLTIWAQTLRMKIIPEPLRGRTFALLRMLMLSGIPLGGMIAAGLFNWFELPIMIGLTALLTILPGIIGLGINDLRTADA